MKKIILTLFILCVFATGFRGGCQFFSPLQADDPLYALISGFRYNGGDGFIDLYYIAAGAGGKIYRSVNPVTDPWVEKSSGTLNNIKYLKDIGRSDTSVTFGVGDNGTIVRSLDQGMTWTLLNSSVTGNLNSIDFIGLDLNNIIAVGELGLIIKSTDGGDNWNIINSGITKNLNSIYSANSFVTYIAGDDGTLLRTSNGGLNWVNQSFADTSADLNKVGFIGTWFFGSILGIVGDNGKLYRSINLLSWDSIYTGTDADLYDFKFKNASSGYVCGDSGTIVYTTDGGNEWFTDFFLQSITDQLIQSTLILNDTTAVGVAGNKIIVTTANEALLPVELISFMSSVSKNNVTLRWTTANEVNNSGFYVERRLTSEEWSNIGFINGNGTTSDQKNYEFTDKNLKSGKYNYRLKQTDYNGNYEYFNLMNDVNIATPQKFSLMQNYPNPFNPSTKIAFDLPYESEIKLAIYDITGKEIDVLVNQNLTAGFYESQWDASDFSSGTYFYRINSNTNGIKNSEVKKMMLIR